MAEGGWDRVFAELKNPWDWAAAAVGAAGGAVVTVVAHGFDLGHAVPAGALGSIGARRAGVAAMERRTLRRKADQLLKILANRPNSLDLTSVLRLEMEKWELKIISSEKFSKKIDEVSDIDSQRAQDFFLLRSPGPASPPASENPQ